MLYENIWDAQVFANFPAKVLFYIRVTGNGGRFAIINIPIEGMVTTFANESTTVFHKVPDQLVSLHQKLKVMV